ncbi:hypothetical protein TYRP_004751 [Tyrophagus putrescentiae]|nr:hypothetical protein TYRP_004751 [Tyrophagus putrescentiae]
MCSFIFKGLTLLRAFTEWNGPLQHEGAAPGVGGVAEGLLNATGGGELPGGHGEHLPTCIVRRPASRLNGGGGSGSSRISQQHLPSVLLHHGDGHVLLARGGGRRCGHLIEERRRRLKLDGRSHGHHAGHIVVLASRGVQVLILNVRTEQ